MFTNGYSSYIPPYWTIHYEIFAFLALLPVCSWFRSKRFFFPLMVAAYAVYVYFDPYYATVILGVITCYLYQNGKLKQIFHSKMKLLILAIGLYCICIPNVKTGIYSIFNARGLSVLAVDTIRGIGTCIAFSSCLLSPKIQKLFEKPILLEAGRISFALYSLHYPVLLYITTALACFFWQKLQIPNSAAVVCSAVLTMPLIWYLSKFAQRYLVETGTSLFHKRAR